MLANAAANARSVATLKGVSTFARSVPFATKQESGILTVCLALPAMRLNSAICAASPARFTRSPVMTTNAGFKRLAVAIANSKFAVSWAKSLLLEKKPN